MPHTQSGLAIPKFCIPRTRCEPYAAYSFWVAEAQVLHSQNAMRAVRCTFILGRRNLGMAFSERDASPMVHTHSGLAKLRFCMPRTRREPYGAHSFSVGETWVACPERHGNAMVGPNQSGINVGCLTAPVCIKVGIGGCGAGMGLDMPCAAGLRRQLPGRPRATLGSWAESAST
jgi:hypothetical protein